MIYKCEKNNWRKFIHLTSYNDNNYDNINNSNDDNHKINFFST